MVWLLSSLASSTKLVSLPIVANQYRLFFLIFVLGMGNANQKTTVNLKKSEYKNNTYTMLFGVNPDIQLSTIQLLTLFATFY